MSARRLGERGVSAVEFAILAPVILTLALGTIEFGWQATIGFALEYGARSAARVGITGAIGPNPGNSANLAQVREDYLRSTVLDASGRLILSDNKLTIFNDKSYNSISDAKNNANGVQGAGNAGQFVIYNLAYKSPLVTGDLFRAVIGADSITHTSTVLVANEQFTSN